jgi:hypothetical protein
MAVRVWGLNANHSMIGNRLFAHTSPGTFTAIPATGTWHKGPFVQEQPRDYGKDTTSTDSTSRKGSSSKYKNSCPWEAFGS